VQADLGIRNRAPDEARLAGRRLQDVAHCVYRGRDSGDEDLPWVRVTGDAAILCCQAANRAQGRRPLLPLPAGAGQDLARETRFNRQSGSMLARCSGKMVA